MLLGLLLAVMAGSLAGLQNIFNSRVNEKTGLWVTTTLVLFMGFTASFIIGLFVEGTNMFNLQNMQLWYWFSGLIGVGIVVCMVQGIKRLGPTLSVSVSLTSQLVFALIFDTFGWLGLNQVPFTWNKIIGVLVIISGILVFKYGGQQKSEKLSEQPLS